MGIGWLRTMGGTLALALSAWACGTPHANPTDLPLRPGSIELHPNGALKKGYLSEPYHWPGPPEWPLQRWVHLYPDGTLRGGQLREAVPWQGFTLPQHSFLWFHAEGHLESVWLAEVTEVEGVACRGGRHSKVSTGFDAQGRLRSAFLAHDQVVQGIPCEASLMVPVRFGADGRIESAQLSRRFEQNGRSWDRGDRWERPAQAP